mmetsp:Transcript_113090/g.365281  ORF Transcript_113090/g.365281 Transcript_113090/m.365281 type:complete len:340 (+) Transcript_113090:2-1021(+)
MSGDAGAETAGAPAPALATEPSAVAAELEGSQAAALGAPRAREDSAAATGAAATVAAAPAACSAAPARAPPLAAAEPAGLASAAPAAPAAAPPVQCFNLSMGEDSDEEGRDDAGGAALLATCAGSGEGGGLGGLTAPPAASVGTTSPVSSELAAEVRSRFRFLKSEDQKTVCRRECQMAQQREQALLRQMQQTIDRYNRALEVGRAIACGPAAEASQEDDEGALGLTPEIVARYEGRIQLLRGTMEALISEPTVTLPQLSALERAKGFVFTSYAKSASTVNRLTENTTEAWRVGTQEHGASASVAQVGSPAVPLMDGARAAWGSLASRFRGGGNPTQRQ